jgi:hypothetical protein
MVTKEREIRLAPETQVKYHEAESSGATDWMEHTALMQEQLCRDFGFTSESDLKNALYNLRMAAHIYPEDPEFREIQIYVKYNRATMGNLVNNGPAPDCALYPLDFNGIDAKQASTGPETTLHKLLREDSTSRPILLCSGSYS